VSERAHARTHACTRVRERRVRASAYDLTPVAFWYMHSLPERREISPRYYAYIIASTHFVIEWPRTRCCTLRAAWTRVAAIRVTLKPVVLICTTRISICPRYRIYAKTLMRSSLHGDTLADIFFFSNKRFIRRDRRVLKNFTIARIAQCYYMLVRTHTFPPDLIPKALLTSLCRRINCRVK